MKDKAIKNEQVLERFNRFYKQNLYPSQREIAKMLGIDYSYLAKWRNGNILLGERKLLAINNFLEEMESRGFIR